VPALEITGNDPVRHIQNLRDVGPMVRCNPEPAQKIEMKRGVGAQKHIALLRCSYGGGGQAPKCSYVDGARSFGTPLPSYEPRFPTRAATSVCLA
jgi:hypothetical protein